MPDGFDFDHHTLAEHVSKFGGTTGCWHCNPSAHRKPDLEFHFTMKDADPELIKLLFGEHDGSQADG